jgi:long-chain fatty acid transport protein
LSCVSLLQVYGGNVKRNSFLRLAFLVIFRGYYLSSLSLSFSCDESKNRELLRVFFRYISLALFGLFLIPTVVSAGAPVHGAKAAGMGTAFVAVADDPSAILHNPAGLTQLKGTNLYGGNTFVVPSTTFKSPSGAEEETEFQLFYPPHMYISSDLGMRNVVVGLGVYSPFGIGGRKWPEEGITRFLSVENFIGTASINPTVALRVSPELSIAFGVDYMLALNNVKRFIDQSPLGYTDAKSELKGDGDGWGYNAGILFSPNERLRFGFAYRSAIRVHQSGDFTIDGIAPQLAPLFGGTDFSTDFNTTLKFPQIVSVGVACMPSRKLMLAFDLEWIGWSSFSSIHYDFEKEVPEAGVTDSATNLDWKDIWTVKVGVDYKVKDNLSLRGGYAYVDSPVPLHTLEPGNPDAKQHNFSVGAGYRKGKWTMDFAYVAGFYENRTVSNAALSGEYDNFVHYVTMSLGYKFR